MKLTAYKGGTARHIQCANQEYSWKLYIYTHTHTHIYIHIYDTYIHKHIIYTNTDLYISIYSQTHICIYEIKLTKINERTIVSTCLKTDI